MKPFSTSLFALRIFALLSSFAFSSGLFAQNCITLFGMTATNANNISPVRIDTLDGDLAVITSITSSTIPISVQNGSVTINSLVQDMIFVQNAGVNNTVRVVNTFNGTPGITSPSISNLLDLEFHCNSNILYGLNRITATSYRVVEVNITTGTLTPVGANINLPAGNTLAPELSTIDVVGNRFFFFSRSGALYTMHVAPLDGSAASALSIAPFEPVDVEFNQVAGNLLLFTTTLQLVAVNPATGTTNLLGVVPASPVSLPVNNGALDPFSNRYFFVAEQTAGNYRLYTVNSLNGALVNTPIALPLPVTNLTASVPCQAVANFAFANSCAGSPTTFTDLSIGASQWTWNFGDPTSGAANTSTEQNPVHTFSGPGSYTVSLNVGGCVGVNSSTQTVTIVTPPSAGFANDTLTTCSGIVSAQNTPGATYFWITGSTNTQITATVSAWYWVDINLSGCVTRDSIYVIVDPGAGGQQIWDTDVLAFCEGAPATLDATLPGATAYQWSTGANTPTINVTTAGIYNVTVTSGPCITTDAVTVQFTPQPVVDFGPDATVCATSYEINPNLGIPGLQYQWSNGATTPTLTITQSGSFSVTVSAGSCSDSDDLNVTLIPLTAPNLGNNPLIACDDTPVVLDATTTLPGATYLWSNNAATPTITVPAGQSGNYAVTIQVSSCSVSTAIDISFSPSFTLELGADIDLCQGNSSTLDAGNVANAAYAWSGGETTQQINVATSGLYSVTVSNGGCTLTDAVTVTERIPAAIDLGANLSICTILNESLTLNAGDGVTYVWQPDGETTSQINVTQPGTYSVTVTDAFGCTNSATATVEALCQSVLLFPNAFSPNGDGVNDFFTPFAQFIASYNLQVYDRWGKLLFESDETNDGWDGTHSGFQMPMGVYVWFAQYTDDSGVQSKAQGNVTLIK